jgi:hypothetical protein
MPKSLQQARFTERGSALVYILIAIALLAALTVTFMEPSSQQTTSQNTFKTVAGVAGQMEVIRSSIQECILSYPRGDGTINLGVGGVTDPDARKNYPIDPDSDHFLGASPLPSGDHLVRNIRCPGNNPGSPNQKNHALIFSGASGKFLPPAPELFSDWQYYNGEDGVFFWTSTDKSDSFLISALEKLDEQYSECEVDIVNATASARDLDSNSVYTCALGSVCFRVRVLQGTSAIFEGDTDGDETAANCS